MPQDNVVRLDAEKVEQLRRAAAASAAPEFGKDEEPEGFLLSDEVAAVAARVISDDPRWDGLADIRVAYVLQWGADPAATGGLHAIAKCVKAPPLWRDLGAPEVVIWAVQRIWAKLSEHQREALIAHELSHIGGRNDSGKVVLLEHDIEEFGFVVRRYGQWHKGLETFAEQIKLGLPR